MNILVDVDAHPVIAHRGNSAHAPENTLVSFDQAVALGADALELDVRLTRDRVPVVIHDPLLDRTTNATGAVAAIDLAELRQLDAGSRFTVNGGRSFPYAARGLTVPTLEEILVRFASIPLLIEVKIAEAAEPTRRLLEQFGAFGRTVVDSAAHPAVTACRSTNGALATGASMPEVIALMRGTFLSEPPRALPYEALCIPHHYYGVPIPAGRLAAVARRAGVATHVWTVNDPAMARRLWRRGVQGIVTDDPGVMLEVRHALFPFDGP